MASGAARASASGWPGAREGSSQGLTFGGRTAALFPGPRRTPRWARRSPLSGLPAGTADLTVPAGTRPPQPTPPAAQGAPGSRFWVPEAVRAGGRDFRALRRWPEAGRPDAVLLCLECGHVYVVTRPQPWRPPARLGPRGPGRAALRASRGRSGLEGHLPPALSSRGLFPKRSED